jgi:phage-related protein (TIGR01555 family)
VTTRKKRADPPSQTLTRADILDEVFESSTDRNLDQMAKRGDAFELRGDGWENGTTGFGTWRDKTEQGTFVADLQMQWAQLSALYYGDDLAARMINAPVEEAFREGYQYAADDAPQAQEFDEWARTTHLVDDDGTSKIEHGETWGRLFGGSLLVVGHDDSTQLDQPLDEKRAGKVLFVVNVDRRNAFAESFYTELGPKIGQVKQYLLNIQTAQSTKSALVHESRCVRVGSTMTDVIKSRQFAGWDQPYLARPYRVLREFAQMSQAISLMMTDASQGVYAMKGLWSKLASPGAKDFHTRMQLVDMVRSIAKSIVVDADGESFTKVATSFASIPELHDRYQQRLSAACGIPVSILFGRSSAGMNATGDLDLESWAATVGSYQKKTVGPRLQRLYSLLALDRDSPSNGRPIKGAKIKWLPLRVPTGKELADEYLTRAQADAIYIENNVFAAQAVALARAGRGEYGTDVPQVDVERLEKELTEPETFDPPPKLGPDGKPIAPPTGAPAPTGTPPKSSEPTPTPAKQAEPTKKTKRGKVTVTIDPDGGASGDAGGGAGGPSGD